MQFKLKKRTIVTNNPINQFLLLAIEVFGCLHKQIDVLLHNCANAIWRLKGFEGLHIYVLVTFLHQKISITLQRMQGESTLRWFNFDGLESLFKVPFECS
jgi:hypothetical protein